MRVNYVIKRIGFLVIVVWAAATINFFLPRVSGQNPIRERMLKQIAVGSSVMQGIEEMIKHYDAKFGLDKPLWQQYLVYLGDVVRLDFGESITFYPRRVKDIIADGMPWTIGLLTLSTLSSFIIGSLFGALIAWPRSPGWLQWFALPVITLSAIPYYLLGLVLLFIFAFELKWFPGRGGYTLGQIPRWSWVFAFDTLKHAVLPAASIVLSAVGFWALGMRGMMVSVEGEDYMTMAEAKGLKARTRFLHYALRNTLLPQTTSLALSLAYVASGSILVEIVFSYPGIGYTLYNAILGVDYPVINGLVMTLILTLALSTLLLDLALPLLDPRITYARS